MLPRVEATWRKLANTATAGFDRDEREQLVNLLDRVRDNLLALVTDEEAEQLQVMAGESR